MCSPFISAWFPVILDFLPLKQAASTQENCSNLTSQLHPQPTLQRDPPSINGSQDVKHKKSMMPSSKYIVTFSFYLTPAERKKRKTHHHYNHFYNYATLSIEPTTRNISTRSDCCFLSTICEAICEESKNSPCNTTTLDENGS